VTLIKNTEAIILSSSMFRVYGPPNSKTRVSKLEPELPSGKYNLRRRSCPIFK